MVLASKWAGAAAVLAAASLLSACAFGASAPDSLRIAELNTRLLQRRAVWVIADAGTFRLRRLLASEFGIEGTRGIVPRASISADRDTTVLIRWADLSRVDARQSGVVRGMCWGAVLGTVLATGLVRSLPRHRDPVDPGYNNLDPVFRVLTIPVGATLGAATGALVGRFVPERRVLFPNRSSD